MDEQELATRVRVLRGVDIFSELRRPLLEELAQKVELIKLASGENLINKGDQGDAMFVITQGQVKVHDGSYEFAKLGQGECFGEYALIDPEVRNASISGATDTTLFKLNRDDFYDLVDESPGFVNSVLIILIRRLRKVDEVQKSLADSYLQISKQKDKIEEQNSQLSYVNEEKNHLMSIVAHDIRSPLSSNIEVAKSVQSKLSADHPEYAEATNGIIQSMLKINEMADKVLQERSKEQKKAQQDQKLVNLGELLRYVEQDFDARARKKNISVQLDYNDVFANLDSMMVRQVFENLVSNAIKFSPLGQRVILKVAEVDGKAIIEVKDQGPGFSDNDKELMYAKFQRLSAIPTDSESSLGLGLSIVKKYVEQMNGEISLVSERGNGACFTVSFDASKPN
jgi:signal transduction histidine kinase